MTVEQFRVFLYDNAHSLRLGREGEPDRIARIGDDSFGITEDVDGNAVAIVNMGDLHEVTQDNDPRLDDWHAAALTRLRGLL